MRVLPFARHGVAGFSYRQVRAGVPACVLAALSLFPAAAGAGGLAVSEQGARSMGFAGAFTAQANDPSAISHNAAGIAFLKGRHLHLGGAWLRPRTTFTGSDPFPGGGVA